MSRGTASVRRRERERREREREERTPDQSLLSLSFFLLLPLSLPLSLSFSLSGADLSLLDGVEVVVLVVVAVVLVRVCVCVVRLRRRRRGSGRRLAHRLGHLLQHSCALTSAKVRPPPLSSLFTFSVRRPPWSARAHCCCRRLCQARARTARAPPLRLGTLSRLPPTAPLAARSFRLPTTSPAVFASRRAAAQRVWGFNLKIRLKGLLSRSAAGPFCRTCCGSTPATPQEARGRAACTKSDTVRRQRGRFLEKPRAAPALEHSSQKTLHTRIRWRRRAAGDSYCAAPLPYLTRHPAFSSGVGKRVSTVSGTLAPFPRRWP